MPIQFPRRRESDEQAAKRAEKIKLKNLEQGYDSQGEPIDTNREDGRARIVPFHEMRKFKQ